MIYKEILVMPGVVAFGFPGTYDTPAWTRISPRVIPIDHDVFGPSICHINPHQPRVFGAFLVSKQTRHEAISIYFGCNRFHAGDLVHLAEFLHRIGPDACNAIREISILYYRRKNADKAFKLLIQCGRLRKIHFGIYSHYEDNPNLPLVSTPLLDRPGIQSLLKVRGIEELDVRFNPSGFAAKAPEGYEKDKESFLQALQILKEPRDFQKQRRLPPNELWIKAPMMTRARASKKEQSKFSNTPV